MVDNGVCFCLPSWKTSVALTLSWRSSGLRPLPALSLGRLLTRALSTLGVAVSPHCILVLPVRRGGEHREVVGLISSKCLSLPRLSLQVFAQGCSSAGSKLLLAASSCCPWPTGEEVTDSCLTLSHQVKASEEAEGQLPASL